MNKHYDHVHNPHKAEGKATHSGSIQILIAAFVISIFAGVLISVGINVWLKKNMTVILSEQKRIEAQKIDYLLENGQKNNSPAASY